MRKPIWNGPYQEDGGLTQSLVAKWLGCRHRFWMYAVTGAVESRGSGIDIPLVYGDAFHNALEAYGLGKSSPEKAGEKIKDYFHGLSKTYPRSTNDCTKWSRIGYDQFQSYCRYWEEEDRGLESLMEEQTFCIPYTLPSGRVIYLRGKWDGVIAKGKNSYRSILDFEHKIKGEVDTVNLPQTLAQNFQVMVYLVPLYLEMEKQGLPKPNGVLYNVIQRPLAGRKHTIKQKKGRKVKVKGTDLFEIKGAETQDQYFRRLAATYDKHPEDFFHRWEVSISEAEVQRFRKESLDPILEQMCDWWDSIQGDPFDPWHIDSVKVVQTYEPYAHDGNIYPKFLEPVKAPNKLHYRRPFGIYDKMAKGLVGDYQEYLTTGNKDSLQKITTVFPELE